MGRRFGRGAALVVMGAAAALVCAGCGTSAQSASVLVRAGQLPPATRPQLAPHGKGLAASLGTVPLAKQTSTTALFSSIGSFQSCLSGKGMTFIGVPSKTNPNSATNAPAYLTALKACAAQSNILQSLKNAQSAQQNLTPSEVKQENKVYLLWRKCMISRGWGIPAPKPNSKGLLFSFSASTGTGGGAGGFKPPPGQSLLNSPDLSACATKAQHEAGGI